jgi:dTDP-4-amino-4,6-dideoxygalactose transaminase
MRLKVGYKGRALGAIGDLGTYSFCESKNVISAGGGSLQSKPRLGGAG